jgi:hypothetical protein
VKGKNDARIKELDDLFKITGLLSVGLREGKTIIFVGKKQFMHCKYLLLHVDIDDDLEEVSSIDEVAGMLDHRNENEKALIPPEVEFWGHCSNLQAWIENDYDTRILHSNMAFPLLNKLAKSGDVKARGAFLLEVEKRLNSGFPPTINFLLEVFPDDAKIVIEGFKVDDIKTLIDKASAHSDIIEVSMMIAPVIKMFVLNSEKKDGLSKITSLLTMLETKYGSDNPMMKFWNVQLSILAMILRSDLDNPSEVTGFKNPEGKLVVKITKRKSENNFDPLPESITPD